MGRVSALAPVSIAGLVLLGALLGPRVIGGHGGKPSPWTSNARFTISGAGTYTVADSTVPAGIRGNAEIDLGMGLSGNRKDFVATIGDDPADDTNVAQWQLIFRSYHQHPAPGGAGRQNRMICVASFPRLPQPFAVQIRQGGCS